MDQLDFLIACLLRERHGEISVPESGAEKFRLFRALVNTRGPDPISEEFLRVQDAYLQALIAAKGVTDAARLPAVPANGRISVWRGDITTLRAGAIVNAANSGLLGCFCPNHGCIDNAIHTYAGVQLRLECAEIMRRQGHSEPAGQAKLTGAYNLPCDYILHTVGPYVQGGDPTAKDRALLADCYRASLRLAAEKQIESVAFCCISTGEFCFPSTAAAEIAVDTVSGFLQTNLTIKKVIFNVFRETDSILYRKRLGEA